MNAAWQFSFQVSSAVFKVRKNTVIHSTSISRAAGNQCHVFLLYLFLFSKFFTFMWLTESVCCVVDFFFFFFSNKKKCALLLICVLPFWKFLPKNLSSVINTTVRCFPSLGILPLALVYTLISQFTVLASNITYWAILCICPLCVMFLIASKVLMFFCCIIAWVSSFMQVVSACQVTWISLMPEYCRWWEFLFLLLLREDGECWSNCIVPLCFSLTQTGLQR